MPDEQTKNVTREFGLGRAGTGAVESADGRDGHPLAMVTDVRRHQPTPAARTMPGLASTLTPPLD
ncbi:MAG: hypothetical protein QG671_1432 [Actinomycetota bacterium]|nr:hypothetical protein [Actinomycetota bacterium]HQZ84410.1 hypothetical protein [Actinomycetota bacterium]